MEGVRGRRSVVTGLVDVVSFGRGDRGCGLRVEFCMRERGNQNDEAYGSSGVS